DCVQPSLAPEPGTRAWHPSLAPEPGTRAWHWSLALEPGTGGVQFRRVLRFRRVPHAATEECRALRRNLRPELSRPGGERRQPFDLQVGARAEQIDPRRRERGEVDRVTAPVGAAAIVVGQSVVAS